MKRKNVEINIDKGERCEKSPFLLSVVVEDEEYEPYKGIDFDMLLNHAYRDKLIAEFSSPYGFSISLPVIWGPRSDGGFGCEVEDPLAIDVWSEESEIRVRYSMGERLNQDIDQCEADGSFLYGLQRFAKAMRPLLDRIDACGADGIKKSPPGGQQG